MWFWFEIAAVCCWAGINVLDSVLVHHYHKHPVVLMWSQSIFSVPILLLLLAIFHPQSPWIPLLVGVGVIAYAGDLVFFRALDLIDVSVTNIAWAILSVFLSVGGFLVLGERWSGSQSAGAIGIVLGVLLLSLWHRKLGSARSLLLLPLLAVLYLPFYFVQKLALEAGQTVFAVSLWPLLGREVTSFLFPLVHTPLQSRLRAYVPRAGFSFHMLNGCVVLLFLTATLLTTAAFAVGQVSLVSIVGNVQPFFVLLLAWTAHAFLPRFAPRELVNSRSFSMKLMGFTLVFGGLSLLALQK